MDRSMACFARFIKDTAVGRLLSFQPLCLFVAGCISRFLRSEQHGVLLDIRFVDFAKLVEFCRDGT